MHTAYSISHANVGVRDLPPVRVVRSGVRWCNSVCLPLCSLTRGIMAEELESLWQKLTVTDEEEVSVNLGKECTSFSSKAPSFLFFVLFVFL